MYGFEVGIFLCGGVWFLLMVLLCGHWGIGCYGFGSSGGSFLGFYLWMLGWVRVEV